MAFFNTILGRNNRINKLEARDLVQSGKSVSMVLPLYFRLPNGEWWLFPYEPLITVTGKNIIKRRYVAKSDRRGSIKERWAEDDLSINIQGTLVNDDEKLYPSDDLMTLYQAITQNKSIEILNDFLNLLNVHHIVVEPFSFPFSKGENVQNFSIDAYSDDEFKLLIDIKDV